MYKSIKMRIVLLFTLSLAFLTIFSSVETSQQSFFSTNSLHTSTSNIFSENFDSTTYINDSATTAYGWGFGNVTLPNKNLTLSRTDQLNTDLFISGDIAYIGGMNGIFIYNISNPFSPELMGSNTAAIFDCSSIFVEGDYLFGAAGPFGLKVINVSDPTAITFITSIDDYYVDTLPLLHDYQDAVDVWALPGSGSLTNVYIWDNFHGLVAITFAEPNTLIQVGGYDPANEATIAAHLGELFIQGDTIYATYYNLLMLDITVRNNPTLINIYSGDYMKEIFVSGNLIYFQSELTFPFSYFKILDISNPLSPSPVYTSDPFSHSISSISVSNNRACIGYSIEIGTDIFEGHFDAYNVSNPSNPTMVYSYTSPVTRYVPGGYWRGVYQLETFNDYGYMFDTKFFIIDFSLLGQYESEATAQSTAIYSSIYNSLYQATLSVTTSIPPSCDVSYYLSPDNGTHWEQVYPDTPHIFTNSGSNLKWKATLSTSDPNIRPAIYSISINYTTILNAVTLTTPTDTFVIDDNTPYFEWTMISGAISYLLQLDTSSGFSASSPDFQNITVFGFNYYTLPTALQDDVWYWRVAAIDGEGDVGIFSSIFMFTVDAPPGTPSLNLPLNDAFTNDDTPLLSWSSAVDAYNYTLQLDTLISFSSMDLLEVGGISSTDHILSSSLSETMWYWRVCAYDDSNNQGNYSTVFHFTIDITLPTIDNPSDLEINIGSTGTQIEWNPNDTNPSSCVVTKNGEEIYNQPWSGGAIVIDVDASITGTYEYNCTVYDKAGNSISDIVTAQVIGTTDPVIPGPNLYLIIGCISVGTIITIPLINRKIKQLI